MPHPVIDAYKAFQEEFKSSPRGTATGEALRQLILTSLDELDGLRTFDMDATSTSRGKSFFAFANTKHESRAVNPAIYDSSIVGEHLDRLLDVDLEGLDATDRNKLLYTAAICICCAIDVSQGNSSRPAYAFEWMIGYLLSKLFGTSAVRDIPGLASNLPIDYFFSLEHCKVHVPVKITTRERASQAWIHQRILDCVAGEGATRGVMILMAETNRCKQRDGTVSIQETCVPEQWRLYQKYIATMTRIYYLDPPVPYWSRRDELNVRQFGDFFIEKEDVLGP